MNQIEPQGRHDTVIAGGTVVTGEGERRVDLAIEGGKVVDWLAPGTKCDAANRIDAEGRFILPGLVDAHVHLREPGLVHKEGFHTGTMAAAAGGVTTVMVMPTDKPATLTPKDFEDKIRLAESGSYVDFALQAGAVTTEHIRPLSDLGAVSFELFLGDIDPSLLVEDALLMLELLDEIANCGAIAGITAADDAVIRRALEKESGKSGDRLSFFRSRPPLSEVAGVSKALAAARLADAQVHLRQISCTASIDLISGAKRGGRRISAEVMPHNLLLTEQEIVKHGPFGKVLPPLRKEDDTVALWDALASGIIDIVATDHAPHTPEEKNTGIDDIWKAPGGFPGLQTLLPAMLKGVSDGMISLPQLVRACSETPARIFGIYPRKGSLAPGSDADLTIVDLNVSREIRNEDQKSKAKITPFAGMNVRGWPVMTILRGRVVMDRDEIIGRPCGEYLPRSPR